MYLNSHQISHGSKELVRCNGAVQTTIYGTSKCTCPIVQVHDLHDRAKTAMSRKCSRAIATCLSAVYYGYL